MSIASEITRINNNIAASYTAVNNKGGTLPATQNSANLATAIASIPSGGGGYTEFPNYQVVNGVASKRSGALTGSEFSNITSVDDSGFRYAFYNHSGLTGTLNLSSLVSVSSNGLYYAFRSCAGLTSVNLSSLTSVFDSGLYNAFYDCTGLTSIDLSSLTSVGGNGLFSAFYGCTGITGTLNLSSLVSVGSNGLYSAFYNCSGITSVDLSSLSSVYTTGFRQTFYGCTGLTNIYFNSLTTTSFGSSTNQFNAMLSSTGTSVTHTLHFPSNLESTISGLIGYPNFGGSSGYVVLSFDLPATS